MPRVELSEIAARSSIWHATNAQLGAVYKVQRDYWCRKSPSGCIGGHIWLLGKVAEASTIVFMFRDHDCPGEVTGRMINFIRTITGFDVLILRPKVSFILVIV